jgi:ribosomal protein S18 acetylase RimI-like enzyme
MQEVQLIKAAEPDIPAIQALAELTWNQHYPSIISGDQIVYMLGKMYSLPALAEQMGRGHAFYLIRRNSENIGFLSVEKTGENEWQLHKFYIDQALAAKGIGSAAFKKICDITRAEKIRLTVNRQNFKAINFYFRNGFKIERVADFDIGNGFLMNDFVMVWESGSRS